MKAPWSYVPVLPAAIGIVAGIMLWSAGMGTLWLLLLLIAFVVLYIGKWHYISIIVLFAFVGEILCITHQPNHPPEQIFSNKHTYRAKIQSVASGKSSLQCIATITDIDSAKTDKFDCRITLLTTNPIVQPGDIVSFTSRLNPISQAPIVPHEIYYDKYFEAEGITSKAILRPSEIDVIGEPCFLQAKINRLRDAMYNGIVLSPIDDRTASFLLAVLLGDDSLMSDTTADEFRATGISHVLALSGLHVGIIVGFLSVLLFPIKLLRRGRLIRSVITLTLIWTYAEIVGMTPSIVRASVMVTVFILASHLQNGYRAFNSLLVAIIFILCLNPRWLFMPGFQLSVSAVAVLLIVSHLIPDKWRRHPVLLWIFMLIVVPIAAMLGTGIIGIYYFNTFPMLFLIANIFAALILPTLLTVGLILMILTMSGVQAVLLGDIAVWLNTLLDSGISSLASIPWVQAKGLFISAWVLLPYFITLALASLAIYMRSRKLGIATLIGLLAVITTAIITQERIPQAELYIPDNVRGATRIIMYDGGEAYIFTDAKDLASDSLKCAQLYEGYLLSRACSGFKMVDKTSAISGEHITYAYPYVTIDDASICIVDNNFRQNTDGRKVYYALISRGYKGKAARLIEAVQPECVIFGRGLHGSTRKRLNRELPSDLTYKEDGVAIIVD